MERIASAKRENGALSTAQHMSGSREIILCLFKPAPKPRSNDNIVLGFSNNVQPLSLFNDGTIAIQGVCNVLSTWSLVYKEPFISSRRIPTNTPKPNPPATAITRANALLGPLFSSGREARVVMRASELGNDCCCS